jgi:hypothetical protein
LVAASALNAAGVAAGIMSGGAAMSTSVDITVAIIAEGARFCSGSCRVEAFRKRGRS